MKHTPVLVEQAALQAYQAGIAPSEIATQLSVHKSTVERMVKRNGDLAETTKDMRADYLSGGFRFAWLQALDKLRTSDELSSQDVKNYGLAMAIAVDKLALVQGWPTQVVAHLHEHRHQVGDIASKLADVARRLHVGQGDTRPDGGTDDAGA